MTGNGRIAFILPHCSATAVSTGRTRLPKRDITSASHASSASALRESRRRTSSTPLRISPSTNELSHRSSSATPFYHAATAGSQPSPLRTSEMTFVSIRKVIGRRHARNRADARDRSPRAARRPAAP